MKNYTKKIAIILTYRNIEAMMRKNPQRRPEKLDWRWKMNHNTASISRFLDSFEDEDGSPPESVYSDSRLNFPVFY